MAFVCNSVLRCDEQISKKLEESNIILSPRRVADLRAKIEEDSKGSIKINEYSDDAVNLVAEARNKQLFDIEKTVKSKGTALIAHLMLLHTDTTAHQRSEIIDTLAAEFSLEVDYIIDCIRYSNPNINPSRESILLGEIVNGRKVYGEGAIWDAVLNKLYDSFEEIKAKYEELNERIDTFGEGFITISEINEAKKLEDQINLFEKIFSNWSNFVFLARKAVRERENIVSNSNFSATVEASIDNFNEADVEAYDPEVNTRESWQQANEERDPFASVGTKVRRVLASLVQTDKDGNALLTDLDSPRYLKPRYVHKTLMETMRGVRTSDEMVERLQESVGDFGWINGILEEITADPYFKTQLFVDVKRNFQYYSEITEDGEVRVKNEERPKIYLQRFLTDLYLRPASLNASIFDGKGNIDQQYLKDFKQKIEYLFGKKDTTDYSGFNTTHIDRTGFQGVSGLNLVGEEMSPTSTKKDKGFRPLSERVEIMQNILQALGIRADENVLKYILSRKQANTLIGYVKALANNGLKTGYTKMASLFEEKDSTTEEYYKKIIGLLNKYNPEVKKLIKVRYRNAKGKTADKYSDVSPSFAQTMIETLQNIADKYGDNPELKTVQQAVKKELKEYLENTYMRDRQFSYIDQETGKLKAFNPWLQELWEMATEEKKDINIRHMIAEMLGADDVVSENLSEKQHALAQLNYYYSKYAGDGNAYYPMFILGDSNKLKFIRAKRYKATSKENVEEQIVHQFYLMYQREFERAKDYYTLNKIATEQGYDALSWSDRNETFSFLQILGEEKIIDDNGIPKNILNEREFSEKFIPVLRAQSAKAFKYFESIGVFEREMKNNKVVLKNFIGSKITAENLETEWYDYFLNHKLALTCQLNLLDIDTSLFPNSEEAQKRNKQNAAPGNTIDVNAVWQNESIFKPGTKPEETAVYVKDIRVNAEETNPEFMEVIAEVFKEEGGKNSPQYLAYKKNTLTDGQSWRTLKSYRNLMIMAGKWNEKLEEAYNIINNLPKQGKLSAKDIKELKKAKAVFQPVKPFTYTFEKIKLADGNEITVPVQIKCAETILIPQLLPEGTLKSMALYMEEKGIDIMVSDTAVKVGAHSSIEFPEFNKEESFETNHNILRESFDRQLYKDGQPKLGIHKLDYTDYRIQTNVPAHTDVSRTLGTQIRKLIMSDLKFYGKNGEELHHTYDKYFDKAPKLFESDDDNTINDVNAKRLIQIYNSLITCNFLSAYESFASTIRDKKKLSKLLQESAIALDKVSTDNIIAYAITGNEEFLIPLFESSMEHDTVSEILSIFRKQVNKQQMRGGSAVQVSSLGIEGFTKDGNLKVVTDGNKNCLYAECEIPFDFHYINEYGQEIELQYEDYCDEDGRFKKGTNGKGTLIEERFPGILDIISYRVPTERNYSTINLKVVRCSKKAEGGTIKVPPQYTTTAGFDFDIDKLYLLRKEFRATHRSKPNEELNAIWSEIYDNISYTGSAEALEKLRAAQDADYKKQVKAGKYDASKEGRKEFNRKNPLYSYWNKAKLTGTAQEAFNTYLEEHPEKKQLLADYNQGDSGLVWDEYNPDILPTEQSSTARNNMLLHIMRQRLMDPETLRSRYSPGGFTESKTAARTIRELLYSKNVSSIADARENIIRKGDEDDTKQPYDPTSPDTMIIYNQMNQVAGKLIGIFANQNINHALASLAQKVQLRTPIAFGDSWNQSGYFDLLHEPNGKDTFKTVAEFLAASVDAVKDPVLNYLNFNNFTANAACLLARLGYSPEEIGILFNQPIIKEACAKAQNDGIPISTAIGSIKLDYLSKGYSVDVAFQQGTGNIELSTELLAKNIIDNREGTLMQNKAAAETQFKILNYFESIVNAADELNDFVQATRFTASAAVGSTMGDIYEQEQKVISYLDRAKHIGKDKKETSYLDIKLSDDFLSPLTIGKAIPSYRETKNNKTVERIDIQKYIEEYATNPFAYEQCMYDCIHSIPQLLSVYYPYETESFRKLRSGARKLVVTKKGVLKESTINTLHREYPHYLLSCEIGSYFDGNTKMSPKNMLIEHTTPMNQKTYYGYQFALDFYHFATKNDFQSKYPALWSALAAKVVTEKTSVKSNNNKVSEQKMVTLEPMSGRGFETMGQDFKDIVREEIEDMAKNYPAAAFGLFFYNFYKIGLSYGGNSFISWFPASVLYNIPIGVKRNGQTYYYVEFLQEMLKNSSVYNIYRNNFYQQFILNHLDDNSFTQKLNSEATTELKGLIGIDKDKPLSPIKEFTISAIDIINLKQSKKLKVFNPIIGTEKLGERSKFSFAPVITFYEGGKPIYYMANISSDLDTSDGENLFNETADRITYTKVELLGVTGLNVSYGRTVGTATRERRVIETEDEALNIKDSESLNDGNVDYTVNDYEQIFRDIIKGDAEENEFIAILEQYKIKKPIIRDAVGDVIC